MPAANPSELSSQALRAVTADESAAFHRDGAVLIKQVLPPDWVAAAAAGLDAAIATPDGMSTDIGALRVDQFPAARSSELGSLVTEGVLAEVVGSTLGAPVSFYMDQLFFKPAVHVPHTPWNPAA